MIDLFASFLISPAQSYYDPATSPITSDLQDDSGFLPPDSPATMDQYIAADGDLFLGDSSDDMAAMGLWRSPGGGCYDINYHYKTFNMTY